jgi:hypothetical protein
MAVRWSATSAGRRLLRDRRSRHLPDVAAIRIVSRHAEPECLRG